MSIQSKNPYNEQVMRMSALQKFPLYPQGITELRDALRRHTATLERATQIIDRVMNDREVCPTPRELVAMAEQVTREAETTPVGCEICGGYPWITVEATVHDRFVGGKDGRPGEPKTMSRSGSRRCDCAKGRWFQQKDRENDAKRKAGLPV